MEMGRSNQEWDVQGIQEELEELQRKRGKTEEREVQIRREVEELQREHNMLQEQMDKGKREKYFGDKIKQVQRERDALQKEIVKLREEKNAMEIGVDEARVEIMGRREKMAAEDKRMEEAKQMRMLLGEKVRKNKGEAEKLQQDLSMLE